MAEQSSLYVLEPKDLICFQNENYMKMSVWSQKDILICSENKLDQGRDLVGIRGKIFRFVHAKYLQKTVALHYFPALNFNVKAVIYSSSRLYKHCN